MFFLNRNVHRLQLTGGSPVQLHRYTHRRELRQFTIQERFTLHSIRIQSRPHSADEHHTGPKQGEEKKPGQGNSFKCTYEVEAGIFSGIPRVTGIPRDGKQNRYELRDWDGRGKKLIGSGRDRE